MKYVLAIVSVLAILVGILFLIASIYYEKLEAGLNCCILIQVGFIGLFLATRKNPKDKE